MTLREAVQVLVLGDARGCPFLDIESLRTLFPNDGDRAFITGLRRLAEVGLIERMGRGLYLNRAAEPAGRNGIGAVARHLRPGHFCYLSYESALAEFGSISQVPMVYIVATTGGGGEYPTPFGHLELCHTSRTDLEIIERTVFDDRFGMRIAFPALAYEDLRRVRPENLHLVDDGIHADVLAEWSGTPVVESPADAAHA